MHSFYLLYPLMSIELLIISPSLLCWLFYLLIDYGIKIGVIIPAIPFSSANILQIYTHSFYLHTDI